ncbi:sensor histidine kinase [Pseudonocardia xinjiangensis]|uniref:sensor histidine kinase n=1 Tax=Pseudonocardia xinjiangensis TaxID=75289 RepID=UPI003D927C0F
MDETTRTVRDRLLDGVLVAITAVIGVTSVLERAGAGASPSWPLVPDLAAVVVACAALWWRRRSPVVLAAALIALSAVADAVTAAVAVALFTVAARRTARDTAVLFAAALLAFGVHHLLRPDPMWPLLVVAGWLIALYVAAVAWGLAARSRRQLIESLRERATVAEVEARLRAERLQHEARETLAREMHDVLGHRLSLLSVHAGAMTYHRDASREEMGRAAEVVRENAHRALQDLREVIGVLRAPVAELPTPGVVDVPALVEEAVRAGTPVELHDEAGVTTTDQAVGSAVGRTLYRLVQEGLTNVRVHAACAPVVVRITGRPGDHLAVEVVNARPPGPPGEPGSGNGLRGLAERAALIGGHLEHGPTDTGGWRVGMWLSWPR